MKIYIRVPGDDSVGIPDSSIFIDDDSDCIESFINRNGDITWKEVKEKIRKVFEEITGGHVSIETDEDLDALIAAEKELSRL